jgi:hypothetical protein
LPVKDVEITLIDAKRVSKRGEKLQNIRIDNNSTITLIKEIPDGNAVIEYRYTANYGGIGSIRIEGSMLFSGDVMELLKTWTETSNMPDKVASEVHTAIMGTCVPEAVLISRDLKLPPPLPLPQIKVGKPKKGGENQSSGMEVA